MNENSQLTQKRLYSEARKRRRASVVMKEVAGSQKSMEKLKQQNKPENSSKSHSQFPGRRRGRQRPNHKIIQMNLMTDRQV
jgi:hypothetical protein